MNGSSAAPASVGRVTLHLDQIQRKEEEDAAQRGVQKKREQVGPAEAARAEQRQRKHRSRRADFKNEKANQQNDSRDTRHWNRFNQREDKSAETRGRQHNPRPVESVRGVSGTRLRDSPDRDREDDERRAAD